MIDLAEFLKALSDKTRLRIMALLFQKEMCVCKSGCNWGITTKGVKTFS